MFYGEKLEVNSTLNKISLRYDFNDLFNDFNDDDFNDKF